VRFPPAPPPFTDRITAVGTLSVEGRNTRPLDLLIDVSGMAAHGVHGWVLGNKATAEDIERAQKRHHGAMHLDAGTGSETITSGSVWIRRTQSLGADHETMPHGLHGIACAFDCLDLTRRFAFEADKTIPREVRFLLRGPRVRGVVSWMHEYSFEGTNKVEVLSTALSTGGGLPFSMSVLPYFLHDSNSEERRRDRNEDDNTAEESAVTSETHVLAMVCRTRKTSQEYSDEAFLAEARQAVEDMCLLLSLLAGGMITWHTYFQSGAGLSIRHYRSLARGVTSARPDEMIERSHLRDFLRAAFRRLRRLRESGIDLEMPIVSAIAGAQARVARQRFGEFFLALEALHSLHVESRGKTFLVEKATFRKVQDDLKKALGPALQRHSVRSQKIRAQMVTKLGELNRPPLWQGVTDLMRRLRVDWEDLYPAPAPERPTFLRLRNSLFHSHTRADDESVYKESLRVEAVVHRILLRWLGWEDLWNVPRPELRQFVAGKALPNSHRLDGRPRKRKRRSTSR
jgi:hypothetical protein